MYGPPRSAGTLNKKKKASKKIESPALPVTPPSKIDDKFLLRAAFKAASDTGTFMDTKFYAFSRRDSSGRAYEPKTIYANGWMLRTRLPSYFEPLLAGGYKESSIGPFHANFPTDQQAFNNDYGYDCDSDLEEYEEREDHTPNIMDSSPENCTIGETSRQDVEAPRRQKDSDDETTRGPVLIYSSSEPKEHPAGDGQITGRVVFLRNFAYPTWKALIFYLCAGEINFAPLRSQRVASSVSFDSAKVSPNAPPCSPKSMYRIADQLGLDELKDLAKKDILSKLSKSNIQYELFSEFTSTYDEICEMEVTFACAEALDVTVANTVSEYLERLASGEHTDSVTVSKCLFQRLSGVGPKNWKPRPTHCDCCDRDDIELNCGHCGQGVV